MFKLTTKTKNWKAVTSSLSAIAEEVTLRLTPNGIECFVMDPSHTEAVGFSWGKESFSVYEIDFEGEPYKDLKISLSNFTSIFKRFGNEVDVTISNKDKAMLVTDGVKNFVCAFYVGNEEEMNIPKIPYDDSFELDVGKFEEMITDCKVFGYDTVYLQGVDGKLIYQATNEAAGKVDGVVLKSFAKELALIGFNYTFMEPVLRTVKPYAEPKMTVEMFPKAPIRLTFRIIDMLSIQYYLAPLIPTQ